MVEQLSRKELNFERIKYFITQVMLKTIKNDKFTDFDVHTISIGKTLVFCSQLIP